jgi:hypothetical protein
MITLPTSTASDVLGIVGYVFTDFRLLIILIAGCILGMWFLGKVIGIFSGGEYERSSLDEEGFKYESKTKIKK